MTKEYEITVLKRSLRNANNVILEKDKTIQQLEHQLEDAKREIIVQHDSTDTQKFIFCSTLDRYNDQLSKQKEELIELRQRLNACP